MKCPKCGYENPLCTSEGQRFRSAVEKRLEQYGYEAHDSPQKHQAYSAVRKIIALRSGVNGRAGGAMTPQEADASIAALNDILPEKEAQHE